MYGDKKVQCLNPRLIFKAFSYQRSQSADATIEIRNFWFSSGAAHKCVLRS